MWMTGCVCIVTVTTLCISALHWAHRMSPTEHMGSQSPATCLQGIKSHWNYCSINEKKSICMSPQPLRGLREVLKQVGENNISTQKKVKAWLWSRRAVEGKKEGKQEGWEEFQGGNEDHWSSAGVWEPVNLALPPYFSSTHPPLHQCEESLPVRRRCVSHEL